MSQPQNPWPQGSWPPGPPSQPAEVTKPSLVSSMAIATELWLVVVLCQAIAYIGQYSSAADSVRSAARSSSSGLSSEEVDLMNSTGLVVGVFVGVGVVVALVSLLIVWMARTGHNWARMVLTFFSAFLVVQTILALFGNTGPTWTMVPTVISGVAALGAAYLLLQRDSETYCKEMTTYRKTGGTPPPWQQPGGQYPANPYPAGQYPNGQYPQQYPPQTQYPYPPQSYGDPRDHQAPYPPQPGGYSRPDSDRDRDDRADHDGERGK